VDHGHRAGFRHHRPRRQVGRQPGHVGADSLLTSIYQVNPMWVRFSLGESDLASLPGGRLFQPRTSAASNWSAQWQRPIPSRQAQFPRQQHRPDPGHPALRAEFANPDSLLPGQFVRIRLLTGERDGVFLVPQSAVMQTDRVPW
jgi:membrane fusion protein (multidrug efflux system)